MVLKIKKDLFYDSSILIYFCGIIAYITYRSTDTLIFLFSAVLVGACTLLNICNRRAVHSSLYLIWYILFCFFACLTMLWALDETKVLNVFASVPIILFTAVVLGEYIITAERWNKALNFLIVAGVVTSVRCLLYTDLFSLLSYYNRNMFAKELLSAGLSYNEFTTPMALICIIAVYLVYKKSKKRYAIAYGVITLTLIISGSRKAIVVAILGLIFVSLLYKRNGSTLKKILIITGVVVAVYMSLMYIPVLYNAVGDIMQQMFDSLLGDNSSVTDPSLIGRAFFRKKAWEIFFDHPILGVGINNFSTVMEQINYSQTLYAHNNFLELLADGGIIGFCMYYWIYIKELLSSTLSYMHKSHTSPAVLVMSIFICLLIMEYGQITYYKISAQLIIAAIVIGYERFGRQTAPVEGSQPVLHENHA